MIPNTFDAVPKHEHINVFKVGKLWLFKHFFDNMELFEALVDHYNKGFYRFEFKSTGARNNALKLLERNGFDYDLVEDLKGYVVKLRISRIRAPGERLFAVIKTVIQSRSCGCNHSSKSQCQDGIHRYCL